MDRFAFIRDRPVLAIAISALSLLVIVTAITVTTPLRCGPAKALGLTRIASGCVTAGSVGIRPGHNPGPNGNPASPPSGNLASAPYDNSASGAFGNPASGAYPPVALPASGSYPPFYPPVSPGYPGVARPPLNCQLPVFAGGPGSGGFLAFPGGAFIADPTSNVTVPPTSPGATPTPQNGPGYQGFAGLSYDHQYSRWLPVPSNQVSPDGSRYAYTVPDGIYVVNVANNTQSELGAGHAWSLVGVQSDSVYAGDANAGGLWQLPISGSPRQITNTGYWRAASSAVAYGTPTSAVPSGVTNKTIRLDLKTGAITDWFTRDGTQASVLGVDGNNAILAVTYFNPSVTELWIASGPASASPIAGFTSTQWGSFGFNSYNLPVADSHGVWLAGNYAVQYGNQTTGVALYVPGSGLYWMSSIGGQLAGGCY
jgi:hypothetical protein